MSGFLFGTREVEVHDETSASWGVHRKLSYHKKKDKNSFTDFFFGNTSTKAHTYHSQPPDHLQSHFRSFSAEDEYSLACSFDKQQRLK